MTFSNITLKALEALSPLLMAAVGWVATRLAQLINSRTRSEAMRSALLRVEEIVFAAVREVQQLLVDDLKARSPDGRLGPADRERVKQAALATVRAELGSRGIAELARVLGTPQNALDHVLATRIEAAVHEMRRGAPVTNGVNTHGPIAAGT
jgi:hypothetical protein